MYGKIEIELQGKPYQLWFNNFAIKQLRNSFLRDNGEEGMVSAIEKLAKENEFALLAEIVWAGICGFKYAKDIDFPIKRQELFEAVGGADIDELHKVWEVYLSTLSQNLDIKEDEGEKDVKKKASPKMKS